MNVNNVVSDIERELRIVSTALTKPGPGECLLCYVYRMLELGCTGLRWARYYRDQRAPRATALEERLGSKGGFCDCEIFFNVYELDPRHTVPAQEYDVEDVTYEIDPRYPDPMPSCVGRA